MIKAAIKSIFLVLWILLFMVLMFFVKKTGNKHWHERFCNVGSAVLCYVIGLRVHVDGEVSSVRPLLLVSNHISYLDILILGWKTSVLFTPKSDMAKWPMIGTVCRLINCIFIERSPDKITEAREKIVSALAKGEVISLFPEGTTGNGLHLLPFKSSLFSIAEQTIEMAEGEHQLFIQPAIIRYTKIGSLPIDSTQWPMIAWYGDMALAPHVWQLLKLGRIDATLTLLPPVTIAEFDGSRKKLANYCHNVALEVLQG